jgi:hypothetical protein
MLKKQVIPDEPMEEGPLLFLPICSPQAFLMKHFGTPISILQEEQSIKKYNSKARRSTNNLCSFLSNNLLCT